MTVKIRGNREIRNHAQQMLVALAKAATTRSGVYANLMPGESGGLRQAAARWLRQMGVPLYASRAGGDSAWYLLLDEDTRLARAWQIRILDDCYSEVCRAHMALKPHKQFESRCRSLASFAVIVGGWLGHDLDRVARDLEPTVKPKWVSDIIEKIEVE